MKISTELAEKIINLRIDFSSEVMKLLTSKEESFYKEECVTICESLGIPFRIGREDSVFHELETSLEHGRLFMEFDNGRLSGLTME